MVEILLALIAFAPPQTAAPPKFDVARAKRVFENNCAACHGPTGEGGRGPNLTVPKLRHAHDDRELAGVIMGGIPGTQMPASWHLGQDGLTQVIGYLHVLRSHTTMPPVPGDAANGKTLFEGKGGCVACHTVNGHGHAYGPELGDIGARRTEESLRQSVEEPNAEVPENFLLVHATTRSGAKVTGLRINEDTFTIQIREPGGKIDSFHKADLTRLDKAAGQSAMPSYKTVFSPAEMQDMIAYLSSLRGEQ